MFERPDNVPAGAGRAGSRGAFDLDGDFPAVDMGRLTGGPEGDSGDR